MYFLSFTSMKKTFFASLLLMAAMQAVKAQMVVLHKTDGQTIECSVSQLDSITFEDEKPIIVDEYDYVEIGGLKWAAMNVGATTVAGSYETCCGDFFAWGETRPRYASMTLTEEGEATFVWRSGYANGYSEDNYPTYIWATLDADHDAATAAWGKDWHTPTNSDFNALISACTTNDYGQEPTILSGTVMEGGIYWLSAAQTYEPEYSGVAGVLFVSMNDITKRIFFPACGYIEKWELKYAGKFGDYWSASLSQSNTYYARHLSISSSFFTSSSSSLRCGGITVRAVRN